MTTLSLYTHRGTPMTSYLNHRYPGGTLHFYPARMSNFSHSSVLIESRILTFLQKNLAFKTRSWRSVHSHNISLLLPVAQRAVCMCVLSSAAPANYLHKKHIMSSFAVNQIKQQLTTCRSTPIAVQTFLLSKQTFLHNIKKVIIGSH